MTRAKRLLGRFLHLANSDPGFGDERKAFYAIKDRILTRWGEPDGTDVQHIAGKTCFGCDGTGQFVHYSGDQDYCERCGGSGWWRHPAWVVLQRYRLGGYSFHIPRERVYHEPQPNVTNIEGFVQHADYGVKARDAWLWLALIFDRRLWWKSMRSQSYCKHQWRPMLMLNRIVMKASMALADWRITCRECGGHTWGATTFVCDKCSRVIDASLPF
jgi:hypothetical protein